MTLLFPRTLELLLRNCILVIGLFCTLLASGQGGKSFLKEAEQFRKDQRLGEALEKYSLAIRVDPELGRAYQGRAEVLELLDRSEEAASDLEQLARLEPKVADHAAKAALLHMAAGDTLRAVEWSRKALVSDPRSMSALQAAIRIDLAVNDLDAATEHSDRALSLKATTDTHYLHGLVRMALRDLPAAEQDLEKVLEWNYLYADAYVALAEVYLLQHDTYSGPTMQLRTLDKAVERTTSAIELDPRNVKALVARSKAYALQKEYGKALDDISKVVALGEGNKEVYRLRASYYRDFGQYQNAINDLNRVLGVQGRDVSALLARADCKEANLDLNGALEDVNLAVKYLKEDPDPDLLVSAKASQVRLAEQVFEMNREADPPLITVIEPYRTGELVQVSSALEQVKVTGYVRDKSLLSAILVNGVEATYFAEDKDPEFLAVVPIAPSDSAIHVEATDLYGNTSEVTFGVERSEGVPPELALLSPASSNGRTISVEAGREELFIEGRASDPSRLRSITVDGTFASFVPDTVHSDFSMKLDIRGKERFTIRAEDRFGNATEQTYALKVQLPPAAIAEPVSEPIASAPARSKATGTTWIIHIENRNYRSFPAVPAGGDEAKMQKAFGNYSVQRTVTKKNMSKAQLERFFNVELRDLVRTNKVNTVLVWYSGHGKNVGGKAYWIPVDGKKDDVYSYFNYGSLKAQMQNYSESVNNTVVVSDAVGSDASFYELTR
ncbi:MAG: tetratricopeptide repeat protein [Flavobacteriales bacterium]|nr:tetratricopeptide repeat protein [Flavobacteriales bacterium]